MGKKHEPIRGMFGMMAGLAVGGAAMGMVGASSMGSGFKTIANTGIGIGVLSSGKKMYGKWW